MKNKEACMEIIIIEKQDVILTSGLIDSGQGSGSGSGEGGDAGGFGPFF